MKTNLPITTVEHVLDPKRPIVSKTDLKGMISYVNPAFVEISGFTREELLGQPHNMVRHPEMPPEAFADMWHTLKADLPWRGLVKNRCKNGDFYWVEAYVTPLFEDGRKVGYRSVRNLPQAAEVREAERLYAAIRNRQATLPPTRYPARISMRIRIGLLAVLPLLLVAAASQAGLNVWLAAALGALLAGGLGVWCWQGLQRPVTAIRQALQQLSEGNFRCDIDTRASAEFTELLIGMTSMQVGLRAVIADVVSGAEQIRAQSGSALRGVGEVVESGHKQSDGIASVAAALEQLSASVREIHEATERSTQHAAGTQLLVEQGQGAMQATLGVTEALVPTVQDAQQRMTQLGDDVNAVNQITQIIKDIADQTNLLALNAAIEAARAGEAGRGFAVVADEVRKLAERTTQSTVEISSTTNRIIEQTSAALSAMALTSAKVEESNRLTRVSNTAFEEIRQAAEVVSSSARDVTVMLGQQRQASQEVAQTMEHLSAFTESNAHSMVQTDYAVSDLQQAAEEMRTLVSHFERSL
ncbi:methyl-accepting chemotaxis protein [Craterilacuibacter sp.]|uniref:methyl-accepting chemotaxis protein n=1 Tax=Craterilacuibacter sp. TaxID=2870909 RepID=UPI003F3567D9